VVQYNLDLINMSTLDAMPKEEQPALRRERTGQIVAAYLRKNKMSAEELGSLIRTVYETLGRLGEPIEPIVERTPAVSIRRSVTQNFVICMECGWKGKMLRRHLTAGHGLTVDQYRGRWRLSREHPMTALGYSERRSALAKQLGLGRSEPIKATTSDSSAAAEAAPKRRGRPPRAAATAAGTELDPAE
jgi:predicted transcriptional regulator